MTGAPPAGGGPARIESAELARYVAPGRALARPHGLVVRLRVATESGPVVGLGEAVVAGDRTEPAWRELPAVAGAVVGSALPSEVDPARPLAGIRGWRPVASTDRGPRRSAKLAVELALLDALSQVGAAGAVPDLGAGAAQPVPEQPVQQLPRAAPPAGSVGSAVDDLTARLRDDPGRSWALKFRLTGDDQHDLAWVRHAAGLEWSAGRERPLWLVGGGRTRGAARDFVRQLAGLLTAGEITTEVLLEEPVANQPQSLLAKVRQRSVLARVPARSPLRELQRLADHALGHRPGATRRLSIVAGESVVSVVQAAAVAGSVGGLHLSLARFGTLVGLRAAARVARRTDPSVRVLLAGERGSRITGRALAALAAGTAEIDRYVPEPPAGDWPRLLPDDGASSEPHQVESSGGSELADSSDGLADSSGGLDLAELATVADELAAVPPVPPPAEAEPPNRFPDYPLSGAALAVRSMLLETEALRLGLPTRRLARDYFLVEHPETGGATGFFDSESGATSLAASASAADKGLTRTLLARAGLPVPAGDTFAPGDRERAYRAGLALGFPLVVKPAGGSKGTAVTVGITSEAELGKALDEVVGSKYADTGIVVERFVTGDDYRLLATGEELLSVVRREPASVVGDGRRTVEELVLVANVARRHNPHLAKRLITLDGRVDDQLSRQGLTRRSVPPPGQRVRLRAEANLSLGGDSREVRDAVHPSVAALATAAVAAIPGLPYAGLDVLLADHRLPVTEQAVHIIEVNSRPVQSLHHFPMYGPPRNVSARLVADAVRAAGWDRPVARVEAPAETLTVRVSVTGRLAGTGYRRWLSELAGRLGLAGWLAESPEGGVEVLAHGPPPRVGLLLRSAFHGPAGAAVAETYAVPVDTVPPTGFRIRPAAPAREGKRR